MLYPKKMITQIGANSIGANVLQGVYWYSFIDNKELDKQLNTLTQNIIQSGERIDNIISIERIQKGKIVIFNREIYNTVANEMLQKVYTENPNFPRIKLPFSIEEIRKNEIQVFVNYIKSIPKNTSEIDIYLYKCSGDRMNTIFLSEGENRYKKNIYGFYLTPKDIEEANLELAKYDIKINTLTKCEMLDSTLGIRYTIDIGKANIIEGD